MADTPEETKKREENRNKRLKSLEEAIRKLTDTEDKSVKIAEKRLKEISRTKRQLEGFDDLGKQLTKSLLAMLSKLLFPTVSYFLFLLNYNYDVALMRN